MSNNFYPGTTWNAISLPTCWLQDHFRWNSIFFCFCFLSFIRRQDSIIPVLCVMPTSTAIPSYFRREKVCTLSLHLSQAHTHPLVLTQVSIGSAMKFPPTRLCKIQFGALAAVCDTWTYSKDIRAFQMAAAAGGSIQRRDCAVPFAYYFQFWLCFWSVLQLWPIVESVAVSCGWDSTLFLTSLLFFEFIYFFPPSTLSRQV